MSIVEDTERTRFCPQTDRRTDRQGETSIPPFQLRWSGGIMIIISFWFKFQWRLFRSSNWQPVKQLVWVMAFSPLQTNQCWSSYIKPFGVNRPQWVNKHTNDSTVDKNRLNWTGIMKQSSTLNSIITWYDGIQCTRLFHDPCPWLIQMTIVWLWYISFDGYVQDCSISTAFAMEILQSCTKPLISWFHLTHCGLVTPYGDIHLGQHWIR